MYFKTADVAGLRLFYREAGDPSTPAIVLLHGFPSSSYQFHDLISLLADRFRVIAPDYPRMGYSEAPDPTFLRPTFDDGLRCLSLQQELSCAGSSRSRPCRWCRATADPSG
jgi:pimeloyl-ACP methyl ester carboxylesterase